MTTRITEFQQQLKACSKKPRRKELLDLARSLEYVSLEFASLPDDIFSVYIDALSAPLLCATSGAEEFATALFNDFGKLSDSQKERFKEHCINNGWLFLHPMLQTTVSDLIARKYPHEVAIDTFSFMWTSKLEPLQGMAYSGAQILSRLLPQSGPERDNLRRLGEIMKRS